MFLAPVIFCFLIGIFILLTSVIFIPVVKELFQGPPFLILLATFFVFGIILIVSTIKEKIKGKLKKFLLLTGISTVGFFLSVLLHNFLYALAVAAQNIAPLRYLMEVLHALFFIIAVFICPIGFLVGTLITILLLTASY